MARRSGPLDWRDVAHVRSVWITRRQLDHARRLMAIANVEFPLVHAAAESVPLPDASFDIVFCDHGAMTFPDPFRTVPEAARLLRGGGLLAFNMTSPLRMLVAEDPRSEQPTDQFDRPYFGMHRFGPDDNGTATFQLPYGEWIRLFRVNELVVEDLIEVQPPATATSTYDVAPLEWARRWPAEMLWKVRRN